MKRSRSDPRISRRTILCQIGGTVVAAAMTRRSRAAQRRESATGCVVGEPTAENVGVQVLEDGGNAIDAVVAAALAGAVAAPHQTGIGGYGGCATLAVDGGRKIVSLDFNSAAPAAMKADTFRPDAKGEVAGKANEFGWLAAGVPGILAGLQLALDRFGTWRFAEAVAPAIKIARDGYPWPASLAATIRSDAARFENDPGSRKLFCRDGRPLAAGATFQNPELADLLATLAQRNSVESFYRGDIGRQLADAFQKHGGLVTVKDLAAYRARLVEPLVLTWDDLKIHTAPLTAGGLTTIQALATLQALHWNKLPAGVPRTQARIEALRLAWRDRLALLGDPDFVDVNTNRLLSADYARDCAARIENSVKAGKTLDHTVTPRPHGGTINISTVDRHGNMAALTLTHGNSFGARVTVEGLGLILGHGMSRFDPRPDHPNAPGPGKRPLHNMAPTVVTRNGNAVMAAGARGGRKIPNALFELLTQFVALGRPMGDAIAAPRLHTQGDSALEIEKAWPAEETAALKGLGYKVTTAGSATISAVASVGGVMSAATR